MDLFGNDEVPSRQHAGAILVNIPEGYESEDEDVEEPDLNRYFSDLLRRAFRAALDLDLDDDRASVDDVKIYRVSADGDSIVVSYIVAFSAYYGCEDQNYADEEHRSCEGTRRGDYWVFDRHVSPEPLAPNEEL
jgi:hypothetical protein